MTPPQLKRLLSGLGLYRLDKRLKQRFQIAKWEMSHPPYPPRVRQLIRSSVDVVRYGAVALALGRLDAERVPGCLGELGVYQGELSRFLREVAPERHLHLFDTFAGFPDEGREPGEAHDERFRDTSVEAVRQRLGHLADGVAFHAGFFPETAAGLGDEGFAFVMLDMDRYTPTLAALEVFYPRLSPGGFVFLHDYNSPESDRGVSRAADEFLAGRPERLVDPHDAGGSVLFRKA